MEAINKFYLNNGIIYPINEFRDEDLKEKIIYEVLRIVDGKPAFLNEHLARMQRSFKLINEEFPYKKEEIEELIIQVIQENDNSNGNIKVTYNIRNGNLKIYYIMHSYPPEKYYESGVKVILYYGERENPNLKIVSTEFRAKIAENLKEANAVEALLVDKNGFITEGSKSNFFAIKEEKGGRKHASYHSGPRSLQNVGQERSGPQRPQWLHGGLRDPGLLREPDHPGEPASQRR